MAARVSDGRYTEELWGLCVSYPMHSDAQHRKGESSHPLFFS